MHREQLAVWRGRSVGAVPDGVDSDGVCPTACVLLDPCVCVVIVQFFGIDIFAGSMRRYLRLVGLQKPIAGNASKAHPV